MFTVANLRNSGNLPGYDLFLDVHPASMEPFEPGPEDLREAAEFGALGQLDALQSKPVTFSEFLHNQARLAGLRDNHPWFVWLGQQIEHLAEVAEFVRAQDPGQLDERAEVLAAPAVSRKDVLAALQTVRESSRLLAIGHWPETAADLAQAALTLEMSIRS